MIAQPTPATTSSSTTTTTRATRTALSRLEVAGILLMVAGDGYINGNFVQPITAGWGAFIDLVHLLPLAILLWLGIELLRLTDESSAATARRRGLRGGVTALAAFTALTCLVMIALGLFAPSLGIGVQDFSDWLAVIFGGGGAALWFVTLFQGRRGA